MTVGMFCYAFGWIGCILPAKCMGGGASGLSLLIYYATGETISIGVMVFIINAILLLIAGFIVPYKLYPFRLFSSLSNSLCCLCLNLGIVRKYRFFFLTFNLTGNIVSGNLNNHRRKSNHTYQVGHHHQTVEGI